jgi:glucokinase
MSAPLAIGIDIGGTTIAGGLVDVSTGEIVMRSVERTPAIAGPMALFERVWAVCSRLRQGRTGTVPVGIGVPELVDRRGVIHSAHLTHWDTFAAQARIALGCTPAIGSDVHCAATAEARFGAIAGRESALYVSIGTGISSALVIDGDVWAGHRGGALVLASSPMGDLIPEDIASGPGLVRLYAAATGTTVTSADQVLAASDTAADEAIQRAAGILAINLGLAIDLLDPEIVVLGGGLGSVEGRYREALVAATRHRIWSAATRSLSFLSAALGPDAGIVGAALLTRMAVTV